MNHSGPIILLINRFAFGGAEQLVVDTVNELHARGIDVRVVTVRKEGAHSMIGDLHIPPERIISVPFRSLFDISAYAALIRLVRRTQPSTIMMHLWFANSVGRIAILCMRVLGRFPTIITFEENVYDAVKSKRQYFLDRLLQGVSDTIVAVSPSVKDSLQKHGINQKRVVVLLNAIDTKQLSPVPGEREVMRESLGIPSDEFVYLFIGRLIHQKGADIMLRAFAEIQGARLLIIGDGVDRAGLEALAADLGITAHVSFLGARRDLRHLFAASDCFVMPSRWEGFSIVLLQALAGGLPVVATDYGSVRDVIREGQSGIIVPVDDVTALADAFSRVRAEPELRERICLGAKEDIQRFSIEPHVDTLLRYAQ